MTRSSEGSNTVETKLSTPRCMAGLPARCGAGRARPSRARSAVCTGVANDSRTAPDRPPGQGHRGCEGQRGALLDRGVDDVVAEVPPEAADGLLETLIAHEGRVPV